MRHIRRAGQYRKDRRFRTQFPGDRSIINRAGTLCGSEPTHDDIDRLTAAHLRASAAVAPQQLAHWIADVCPSCMSTIAAKGSR